MLTKETESPDSQAFLASLSRHPGFMVLLCTDETIYLSKDFAIWTMGLNGAGPRRLASVPVSPALKQAVRWRYLRRLGRLDVRELIQVPGAGLLAIVRKGLFLLEPGSEEFSAVFQVTDGGRPKGLAVTPRGHIYVGEYFFNPQRKPLRIWGSADGGRSWGIAHILPAGSAQHIHNLVWDPYRQGVWILTGDLEGECALLFTQDDFQTVTEVVRGGQIFRACQIFPQPDGLCYGTDSETDKNWVISLNIDRGHPEKIHPLPGSCIYAAHMAGRYFLSTAVEPSKVNHYHKTALWSSLDLQHWSKIIEFQKDWLPGEYFGFGNIILPRIQKPFPKLIFSTLAVKNYDLTTFIANNL
jgi:hypothetical protein